MLEYDNSAFYYFSLTLLVLYAVPAALYTIQDLYVALKGGTWRLCNVEIVFEMGRVE
jgi:hypothetical protein